MLRQVHDAPAKKVPSAFGEPSAFPRKVGVVRYAPQPHRRSGEYAVVDSMEHLLHRAGAGLAGKEGERSLPAQFTLWLPQPAMGLSVIAEDPPGQIGDARQAKRLVGLLNGERLPLRLPARQRSFRHDKLEYLDLGIAARGKRVESLGSGSRRRAARESMAKNCSQEFVPRCLCGRRGAAARERFAIIFDLCHLPVIVSKWHMVTVGVQQNGVHSANRPISRGGSRSTNRAQARRVPRRPQEPGAACLRAAAPWRGRGAASAFAGRSSAPGRRRPWRQGRGGRRARGRNSREMSRPCSP